MSGSGQRSRDPDSLQPWLAAKAWTCTSSLFGKLETNNPAPDTKPEPGQEVVVDCFVSQHEKSPVAPRCKSNGEGGIRTHGDPKATPVFKTGAFNRSAQTCGR